MRGSGRCLAYHIEFLLSFSSFRPLLLVLIDSPVGENVRVAPDARTDRQTDGQTDRKR